LIHKQMLNTAVMGFNRESLYCMQLIWEWKQLSQLCDLISPNGSNRQNHRQDQSLISLIYYFYNDRVPIICQRHYDIKLHQHDRP